MSLPVAKNAADILKINDREMSYVDVPEWNCSIAMMPMSGTDRDEFELSLKKRVPTANPKVVSEAQDLSNLRAKLVAACAVNEDGSKLFTTKQVAELGKKNAKALNRCFEHAMSINGFAAEDVEELAKN